jgi:serine protease
VLAAPSLSAAASVGESETGKHIVTFTRRRVPADFAARVTARGGAVDEILGGPGIAFVSGLTSAAAANLAASGGIDAVGADMVIGQDDDESSPGVAADPMLTCGAGEDSRNESHDGRRLPSSAACYAYQWNLRAIKAQAAWRAGHFGSRQVRVYLLDTGVDYTKPDLVGLVDLSRSKSVLPDTMPVRGERALAASLGVHQVMDFHSHGTGVASMIASNGVELAGVSTKTTIVAVKVLDRTRMGSVRTFIAGIDYAARERADVIHLSLSFMGFVRPGPKEDGIAAINAVTSYAHDQGAVIIAAAGNAGQTLDGTGVGSRWRFCNAEYVICVSATGPTEALGPTKQLHVDEIAPYTNFGRNTVTVAGPGGGDTSNVNLSVLVNCSHLSRAQPPQNPAPCSTGAQRFHTTGTTFSAAVTSGLAALIISRIGHGQPDEVRKVLVKSADHLGRTVLPDDYIGMGRINVARAMALLDHDHGYVVP